MRVIIFCRPGGDTGRDAHAGDSDHTQENDVRGQAEEERGATGEDGLLYNEALVCRMLHRPRSCSSYSWGRKHLGTW